MKLLKGIVIILTSALLSLTCTLSVTAQSEIAAQTEKTKSVKETLDDFSAKSLLVCEVSTGKVLFEKNSDESFYTSHLTKLMTLLLTAEKLDCGEISIDEKFTVSELAHNQPAPQIWLDKGEKISVEELVKAITIGNANDAAVCLAENIGGSCEKFTEMMNARCRDLKMNNTVFTDCTGIDEGNISDARDIMLLCRELLKYKNMTPYLTTWIDNVRDNKAELVNSNRLVRTYKGMTGLKACTSSGAGSCICAGAQRNNMEICAVVIGSCDNNNRDKETKQLLDMSFESYQMYTPQIPDELLQSAEVTGGELLSCEMTTENLKPVVIPRGAVSSLKITTGKDEKLTAPVKKGQECGYFSAEYAGKEVCRVKIVSSVDIEKMNWQCAVGKLLYNLLNL